MKKYSFYILIGVIIVLGVLIYLFANPQKESRLAKKTNEALLFSNFQIETVTRLAANKVSLQKGAETWQVLDGEESYLADEALIANALETIKDLKQGTVASKTSEKHTQLGVDSENGLQVIAWDISGQELVNFYIGNDGPAFQTQYVRKANEDQVYLVSQAIKPSFNKNITDWREKEILTLDQTQISSLILNYPDQELQLEKGAEGWQLKSPEEFTVSVEVINELLSTLSTLRASGFATAEETAEFENNKVLTITIKSTKIENKLTLAQKDENYFAQLEGNNTIFKVSQFTVENLTKKIEDFRTE